MSGCDGLAGVCRGYEGAIGEAFPPDDFAVTDGENVGDRSIDFGARGAHRGLIRAECDDGVALRDEVVGDYFAACCRVCDRLEKLQDLRLA